jgi:hypothetical protein
VFTIEATPLVCTVVRIASSQIIGVNTWGVALS